MSTTNIIDQTTGEEITDPVEYHGVTVSEAKLNKSKAVSGKRDPNWTVENLEGYKDE